MFTTTSSTASHLSQQKKPEVQIVSFIARCFAINPLLTLTGLANIVVLVVALIGIFVDPRIITGVPAWIKPAKFAISFSVYCFTFVWLLSLIRKKIATVIAIVTSIGTLGEMGLIVMQVIRGVQSHFNYMTPFDAIVWQVMAFGAMLLFLGALAPAIYLMFVRGIDPALIWSLRLGIFIMLVGMATGTLMTQGTPAQIAAYQAGHLDLVIGAHSVGALDGGPGLPFLGWSTIGGDLRIPHFIGMHALQVLPVVGWLIARSRSTWLLTGHRIGLVLTFGASYLSLIGLLTWQALRAQSIIAPDTLTLQAFAVLLSATALTFIFIITHARMSLKQA